MTFKVEVNTYGDPEGSWSGNAVKHKSKENAVACAKDLFQRWTAVKYWRVVDENGVVVETGP